MKKLLFIVCLFSITSAFSQTDLDSIFAKEYKQNIKINSLTTLLGHPIVEYEYYPTQFFSITGGLGYISGAHKTLIAAIYEIVEDPEDAPNGIDYIVGIKFSPKSEMYQKGFFVQIKNRNSFFKTTNGTIYLPQFLFGGGYQGFIGRRFISGFDINVATNFKLASVACSLNFGYKW